MRLVLSFLFSFLSINFCNISYSMMNEESETEPYKIDFTDQQTTLASIKSIEKFKTQNTTRKIAYLLAGLIPDKNTEEYLKEVHEKPLDTAIEKLFSLGEIDLETFKKLHTDHMLNGSFKTLRAPRNGDTEMFNDLLKKNTVANEIWQNHGQNYLYNSSPFMTESAYGIYRLLIAGQKSGYIETDGNNLGSLNLSDVKVKDAIYAILIYQHYFKGNINFKDAFNTSKPRTASTSKTDSTNDQQNKRRVELIHNTPQAKRLPYSRNGNYDDDLQRALQASLEETNNLAGTCNNFDTEHQEAIDRSFAEEASNLQSNQPPKIDGAKEKLINDILENPNFSPEDKNIFISELFESNNNEAIESTACASSAYTSEPVPVDRTIPEKEMTPEERRINELPSEPAADELRNLRLRHFERSCVTGTSTNSNKSDSPNAFIN